MPSGWWAPSSLWARTLGALSGSPAHHVFSPSLLLAPIAPGMGVLSPELLGTPPCRGEVLLWPLWSGDSRSLHQQDHMLCLWSVP